MQIPSKPQTSEKQNVLTTESRSPKKSVDAPGTTPKPRVKGKKENSFSFQKKSIESRTATHDTNKP